MRGLGSCLLYVNKKEFNSNCFWQPSQFNKGSGPRMKPIIEIQNRFRKKLSNFTDDSMSQWSNSQCPISDFLISHKAHSFAAVLWFILVSVNFPTI